MINLIASTFIERPVKQVFDFVSTPENDFQWQYGTLASARLSEGGNPIGSVFRTIGHLMGRRVLSTFEVTEYEPDKSYGFKSLSGPLTSHTFYTFEIANGTTKLALSTKAKVVNFFQMDEGVLERKMKKQLNENLAMLKNLLEAKRTLPVSATISLTPGNMN